MSVRSLSSHSAALLALAFASACTTTPAAVDTGSVGNPDTGVDAFVAPTDTGGSGTDTGVVTDTGVGVDAFVAACGMTYAGCTALADHTADTSPVVITTTSSFTYSPNCIRIHTGQMVTIAGSSIHPLQSATCGGASSPIPTAASTTGGTYTFTTAGTYGYHCSVHGSDTGTGMAGLIVVQ